MCVCVLCVCSSSPVSAIYDLYPVHSHFCYMTRYLDYGPPWLRTYITDKCVCVCVYVYVGGCTISGKTTVYNLDAQELVALADGSLLQR